MKILLVIIFIFCCQYQASAQQNNTEQIREISELTFGHDTLSSCPSHFFYQKDYSMEHDYDYEKTNKINSLKLRKAELEGITVFVSLISMYGFMFLTSNIDNDLNLLWKIPVGSAIAAGEVILIKRYINNIQKEIDVIQSSRLYSYNINKKIQLDAIHFSNKNDIAQHSFGVSLKFHL